MKVCVRCKTEKSEDNFKPDSRYKSGYFSYCNECVRKAAAKWRAKNGIMPRRKASEYVLPESKKCTRCLIIKPISDFRVHEKYPNSTCIGCDKELAAIYYAKRKDDPVFKKKNLERVRAYVQKNVNAIRERRHTTEYREKHLKWEKGRYERKRDEINAKAKIRRQTPEYKAMMKAYREKNKAKIYQQEIVTKKRYHEKHRNAVTDEYIIRQLINQDVATREMLEMPENYTLIEAKRLQILIKRKIKNNE